MLANTDKTLAIVILPTVLACSQVGCARIPKIPGAKDPATWSAVIAAISAGVGIRAEARQGDSEARTRDKDKQSNEVAVIIDVPTESQNGVKSKSIFAYVDCRYNRWSDWVIIYVKNNTLNCP